MVVDCKFKTFRIPNKFKILIDLTILNVLIGYVCNVVLNHKLIIVKFLNFRLSIQKHVLNRLENAHSVPN